MSAIGTSDPRVLVIGSINEDVVIRVERSPESGETIVATDVSHHWGGKGANQAVAAARWGANVELLGAVGSCKVSADALAALKEEGVGICAVARRNDVSIGRAYVVVDDSGANRIIIDPGANAHVVDCALPVAELCPVVLCSLEVPVTTVVDAILRARGHGWTAILNPAPALALGNTLDGSGVIITPNESELRILAAGEGDFKLRSKRLQQRFGGPVITTLGARGAYVVTADGELHVPAPVSDAVDTTGAGDTLNGVLAAALASGASLHDAVVQGVEAASMAVVALGARSAMPRISNVRGRFEQRTSG